MMADGTFTIATRVYLTAERRAKLDRLLRGQGRELDELLTELLAAYIDAADEPPPPANVREAELREELRQRRAELRRLRPQLTDPHNSPPAWLRQMVHDLSAEITRLERELTQDSP